MTHAILIVADASGRPSEHSGRLVSRYDPDYMGGLGRVWTSDRHADALLFETAAAAFEYWRQPSKVRPLRDDGKPNRPLTAFTVQIVPLGRSQ